MNRLRALRSERGAELVEFALVLPIFLILVGGITDFARLFFSYEIVTNAAREGARLASLPGYDLNNYQAVRNRVSTYLANTNASGTATTTVDPVPVGIAVINATPRTSGIRVTVTYTHDFLFVGRMFGLINGTFQDTLTYQVTAVTRSELPPPPPTPGGAP
jgi:Flp pilus assembly protein TadG